jgi:phage terminase Nu1 subunit (DNA packaging protein)
VERKNEIEARKLVVATAVEAEWAAIVISCRDAILAAPARIQASLPHLTAFDIATIDACLRETLTRLGSST